MCSRKGGIARRALLLGALCAAGARRAGASPGGPRFVSLDHGLAQTLVAIGARLVGVSQTPNWGVWTIEPPLPAGVANLGTSRETNMELLERLRPDVIVSTPYLEGVRHLLERVAPVHSFPIHALGASPWPNILAATRRLGAMAGREAAAAALIERTERALDRARARVAGLRGKPLVLVHFLDARHVRVYGPNCILQDVLDRLRLRNGWTGPTNAWGFATAGIERLVDVGDAWVLVFDPVPPEVPPRLAGSPLWQSLPFVRAGRVRAFPNVLAFGALPAAIRLARLLGDLELRDG